jgi:small subunit ribosomal protein S15
LLFEISIISTDCNSNSNTTIIVLTIINKGNGWYIMARMHSKKKGRSGSEKPIWAQTPAWIERNSDEIKTIVIEKAREGITSANIGAILRDSYGVPSVKRLTGMSISAIMKENKLYPDYPEDFLDLVSKAYNLRRHLETNKSDVHSKRGLLYIESKIRRLVKYYRSSKVFEQAFKYEPNRAPYYLRGRQ